MYRIGKNGVDFFFSYPSSSVGDDLQSRMLQIEMVSILIINFRLKCIFIVIANNKMVEKKMKRKKSLLPHSLNEYPVFSN